MPDWKEMYLTLFRACEEAAETLMEAQRACEALYVEAEEGEEAGGAPPPCSPD